MPPSSEESEKSITLFSSGGHKLLWNVVTYDLYSRIECHNPEGRNLEVMNDLTFTYCFRRVIVKAFYLFLTLLSFI